MFMIAAASFSIGLFMGVFGLICAAAYLGTSAIKRALGGRDHADLERQ